MTITLIVELRRGGAAHDVPSHFVLAQSIKFYIPRLYAAGSRFQAVRETNIGYYSEIMDSKTMSLPVVGRSVFGFCRLTPPGPLTWSFTALRDTTNHPYKQTIYTNPYVLKSHWLNIVLP
jgi:hypothetical protein